MQEREYVYRRRIAWLHYHRPSLHHIIQPRHMRCVNGGRAYTPDCATGYTVRVPFGMEHVVSWIGHHIIQHLIRFSVLYRQVVLLHYALRVM